MALLLRFVPLLLAIVFTLPHYSLAAHDIPRISKPPMGERWFSISKNKEQTGFNRQDIRDTGSGYEITVESGTKMSVLGFSREAVSWERYQVNRDLSLKSFEVEEVIDGKQMKLKGEVNADGVRVTIITDKGTKEKTLKVTGAVYPSPALNILPLMQGGEAGKSFHVKMLDIEKIKVIGVKISIVGMETSPGGAQSIHLQNDLYTFVDNDIWVDLGGGTIRESVSRANIITQAEDGDTVRKFLATRPWLKRR